jgi:hypothetical protein
MIAFKHNSYAPSHRTPHSLRVATEEISRQLVVDSEREAGRWCVVRERPSTVN